MSRRVTFVGIVASVFVVLMFAMTYAQNLIINGSFESPIVPVLPPGWLKIPSGTSFGGWVVDGNDSVDIHARQDSILWTVPDGTQALDLNGNNAAIVYQELLTAPGFTYTLRFYMSANLSFSGHLREKVARWLRLSALPILGSNRR